LVSIKISPRPSMACIALWMRLVHTWLSSPTYAEIGGKPRMISHCNAILSILQLMRQDDQRVLDARVTSTRSSGASSSRE
jgi:hypothetical protein